MKFLKNFKFSADWIWQIPKPTMISEAIDGHERLTINGLKIPYEMDTRSIYRNLVQIEALHGFDIQKAPYPKEQYLKIEDLRQGDYYHLELVNLEAEEKEVIEDFGQCLLVSLYLTKVDDKEGVILLHFLREDIDEKLPDDIALGNQFFIERGDGIFIKKAVGLIPKPFLGEKEEIVSFQPKSLETKWEISTELANLLSEHSTQENTEEE